MDPDKRPEKSGPNAFVEGFFAPWNGLKYMRAHSELWRYAVVPTLLNVIITAVVASGFISACVGVTAWLHPKFSESWWGWAGEILTIIGLLTLAAGAAAATWILLQGILCGYFYTKLACQVELQLGINPQEIKEAPFRYQVLDATRNALSLIAINAGFLLLHCVPVIGSVVGFCGALYFDCVVFGRDHFDYPLSLRGQRRDIKLEFFRRRNSHVLGLGASVLLINLIPFVGAVVLTTAVVGAVLLHRSLLAGTDVE
jgi:uncharacterized protein involved in cysteine biosynthesis